jgi:hypothetical protein
MCSKTSQPVGKCDRIADHASEARPRAIAIPNADAGVVVDAGGGVARSSPSVFSRAFGGAATGFCGTSLVRAVICLLAAGTARRGLRASLAATRTTETSSSCLSAVWRTSRGRAGVSTLRTKGFSFLFFACLRRTRGGWLFCSVRRDWVIRRRACWRRAISASRAAMISCRSIR